MALSALVGEGGLALSARHSGCPGLCDSKDRSSGDGRDETLYAEGGLTVELASDPVQEFWISPREIGQTRCGSFMNTISGRMILAE